MLKVNVLFAIFLAAVTGAWMLLSGLGGYTNRNAVIMARSTSIISTIDGEVTQVTAEVGSKVSEGSLLVTIENDRIDRGRLAELSSGRAFLEREVATIEEENLEIRTMMQGFSAKASAYLDWMEKDLGLKRKQIFHRLRAAENAHAAKVAEVERMSNLVQKSQISAAALEDAESAATIRFDEVEALRAELARIDLRIASVEAAGVLHDNGNPSYWDEVRNTLELRLLDNRQQAATVRAKLAQIEGQIVVENERLKNTFAEEHRVQFDGLINAVLASEGERVIAGTTLLEVLDCANPIAIVPVPDHMFGQFFIGQMAMIKPLDSNDTIVGVVQHISSGALISRDTSIAASSDLTLGGNRVIVGFQNQDRDLASSQSCDTARRAAVTIETDTFSNSVSALLMRLVGAATEERGPSATRPE